MLQKIVNFLLVLLTGAVFLTGCYIPPNENVGRPAPHSYHHTHYYYNDYYGHY